MRQCVLSFCSHIQYGLDGNKNIIVGRGLALLYQHLEDVYYHVQLRKVYHCTIDECHMVQLYMWYCPAFYRFVTAMTWMKQQLLFLAILVTEHLNITWYANANNHLAAVLSHHWRQQYDDMHINYIESNHDFDVFHMRFCNQWSLWVKFAVCDENFELPEMVVALSCAYVWKFHYVLNQEGLIV